MKPLDLYITRGGEGAGTIITNDGFDSLVLIFDSTGARLEVDDNDSSVMPASM